MAFEVVKVNTLWHVVRGENILVRDASQIAGNLSVYLKSISVVRVRLRFLF